MNCGHWRRVFSYSLFSWGEEIRVSLGFCLLVFLRVFYFFWGLVTSGALIGLWVAGRCVSAGIQWIQHEMGSVASGQGFSKGGKTHWRISLVSNLFVSAFGK